MFPHGPSNIYFLRRSKGLMCGLLCFLKLKNDGLDNLQLVIRTITVNFNSRTSNQDSRALIVSLEENLMSPMKFATISTTGSYINDNIRFLPSQRADTS